MGSWVQHETPEEDIVLAEMLWRYNEEEDNSLNTLSDKNHQAPSSKFRQTR